MTTSITNKPSATPLVLKMGLIFAVLGIAFVFFQYYSGNMEKGVAWPLWVAVLINCIIAVVMIKNLALVTK